ncbi:MAG: hypothetical protein AVDCRST_MAG49-787, partial [uncultured Thermomicrobiales bacterium]
WGGRSGRGRVSPRRSGSRRRTGSPGRSAATPPRRGGGWTGRWPGA